MKNKANMFIVLFNALLKHKYKNRQDKPIYLFLDIFRFNGFMLKSIISLKDCVQIKDIIYIPMKVTF